MKDMRELHSQTGSVFLVLQCVGHVPVLLTTASFVKMNLIFCIMASV